MSVIMNGKTFNDNSNYKAELEKIAFMYISAAYIEGRKVNAIGELLKNETNHIHSQSNMGNGCKICDSITTQPPKILDGNK